MSKYSNQALHEMAAEVVIAGDMGDPRYGELILTVAAIADMDPFAVERRIRELAAQWVEA